MNINWIDNNWSELNQDYKYDGPLVDKMSAFKENQSEKTVNIIATNKHIAFSLLKSFTILDDNFPNLSLRLGWMDSEMVDNELEISNAETLIVGKSKEMLGYSKVLNDKSIHISSKARTESQYLAYQRHFFNNKNPKSISLGNLKADISQAETEFRKANSVFFHIDAISRAESHSEASHTAGLDIYESCSLMRLAGLSKALGLMYINIGDNNLEDKTSDVISILIWYFLEGRKYQEIETMQQTENKVFLVATEYFKEPIKFVVGHRTGRWWYQHPYTQDYVPCSDKDYKAISMGSLPDALLTVEV